LENCKAQNYTKPIPVGGQAGKRVVLRSLLCCDCGFESLRDMDVCLSCVLCAVR